MGWCQVRRSTPVEICTCILLADYTSVLQATFAIHDKHHINLAGPAYSNNHADMYFNVVHTYRA